MASVAEQLLVAPAHAQLLALLQARDIATRPATAQVPRPAPPAAAATASLPEKLLGMLRTGRWLSWTSLWVTTCGPADISVEPLVLAVEACVYASAWAYPGCPSKPALEQRVQSFVLAHSQVVALLPPAMQAVLGCACVGTCNEYIHDLHPALVAAACALQQHVLNSVRELLQPRHTTSGARSQRVPVKDVLAGLYNTALQAYSAAGQAAGMLRSLLSHSVQPAPDSARYVALPASQLADSLAKSRQELHGIAGQLQRHKSSMQQLARLFGRSRPGVQGPGAAGSEHGSEAGTLLDLDAVALREVLSAAPEAALDEDGVSRDWLQEVYSPMPLARHAQDKLWLAAADVVLHSVGFDKFASMLRSRRARAPTMASIQAMVAGLGQGQDPLHSMISQAMQLPRSALQAIVQWQAIRLRATQGTRLTWAAAQEGLCLCIGKYGAAGLPEAAAREKLHELALPWSLACNVLLADQLYRCTASCWAAQQLCSGDTGATSAALGGSTGCVYYTALSEALGGAALADAVHIARRTLCSMAFDSPLFAAACHFCTACACEPGCPPQVLLRLLQSVPVLLAAMCAHVMAFLPQALSVWAASAWGDTPEQWAEVFDDSRLPSWRAEKLSPTSVRAVLYLVLAICQATQQYPEVLGAAEAYLALTTGDAAKTTLCFSLLCTVPHSDVQDAAQLAVPALVSLLCAVPATREYLAAVRLGACALWMAGVDVDVVASPSDDVQPQPLLPQRVVQLQEDLRAAVHGSTLGHMWVRPEVAAVFEQLFYHMLGATGTEDPLAQASAWRAVMPGEAGLAAAGMLHSVPGTDSKVAGLYMLAAWGAPASSDTAAVINAEGARVAQTHRNSVVRFVLDAPVETLHASGNGSAAASPPGAPSAPASPDIAASAALPLPGVPQGVSTASNAMLSILARARQPAT